MSAEPFHYSSRGKCPWCQTTVKFDIASPFYKGQSGHSTSMATEGAGVDISIYSSGCPECLRPIVVAKIGSQDQKPIYRLVLPPNRVRLAPSEVPKEIAEDFLEAAAVISISEKASAALSRRCLQNLLNERGIKGIDLSKQIDKVIKKLPEDLAGNVDAVRNIGNFAAHPLKSKSTGLVVDVEPEEADWNLDVLEGLFEYFYVRPVREKAKKQKLDEKLKDLGKPVMKKP